MYKKAEIQLSISTIVILVIALVLIGVAIPFITKIFNTPIPIPEAQIPEPTNANPITFLIPDGFKIGDESLVGVGIFNKEDSTFKNVTIVFDKCDGIVPEVTSLSQDIERGEIKKFVVKVKIPKDSKSGSFICDIHAKGINNDSNEEHILVNAQKSISLYI
ncbi:hypothetical protein K9L67_04485 [Candidatus Woesearchaeota archaeon]|nr:hypothetical protein [Candidatus Woesearchaeota archaeon]MCF7901457.1 hypothetical protein [Candidatus Woesearchaeota archaeon]MCF8013542.1 hypothetical protein [Candidatus Woesearchaeota archaeon]